MKKRKLRDLEVSDIGMGCMAFSHGYGEIPEESYTIDTIRKAFDHGCTFFDTAEVYGPLLNENGHNEKMVGKALKDVRDQVVIATKFHFTEDDFKNEKEIEDYMRKHLQNSLNNLGTDYIDLYYLHRINKNVPVETVAKIMGKFIDEGLIKGYGLSQVNLANLKKAHEVTPVTAVQNLYNMVERDAEKELLPYMVAENIGFVPFSPTSSGFLSGKLNKDSDFSHADDVRKFVPQLSEENLEKNLPIIDLLEEYSKKKNATKAQISLAWMLKKYPNVVPIPGSKNIDHIIENLDADLVELSDEEFAALENALNQIPVYGHRGQVEYEDSTIADWGKEQ